MLGYPLGNIRVTMDEIEVLILCRFGYGVNQAFLGNRQPSLHHEPENTLKFGYFIQQHFLGNGIEYQQFRFFQRFNEQVAGLLMVKTRNISDPPVFHREHQGHFKSVFINKISAYTALVYISLKLADFPFLQQVSFFGVMLHLQQAVHPIQFSNRKRSAFGYISVDGFKHTCKIQIPGNPATGVPHSQPGLPQATRRKKARNALHSGVYFALVVRYNQQAV